MLIRRSPRRPLPLLPTCAAAAVAAAVAVSTLAPPAQAAESPQRLKEKATRFYTPPPDPGAVRQIRDLVLDGDLADALRITKMIATPQAVWFSKGTPAQVRREVRTVVGAAARQGTVPILVAYNLPFRDCAQYSAGGATGTQEYLAWIDGLARGIGSREAIVLLEPDGLGIIPFNTDLAGNPEWCQPRDEAGNPQPGASAEERYRALNGAVDRLAQLPNVRVYLDGTHSAWLGVGDISSRLVRAGVERTRGFFLNVSNYETTERQQRFGSWISQCIAFAANPDEGGWRLGHYDYCASQYSPADPADISTWDLTDAWYAANLGAARPTTHFVVDTSRNGQGPWTPPAGVPGDPQVWCNPPDRGLGLRPTTETGNPLNDAFLWVKIPGESDGECYRWTSGPLDPVRGMQDPPAGEWFPEMALELVRNANPPLLRH